LSRRPEEKTKSRRRDSPPARIDALLALTISYVFLTVTSFSSRVSSLEKGKKKE